MLQDWYFCCCIKADPDKSTVFLEILDALEEAGPDPELARLAIEELTRMDVWMQGYALPAVLRCVDRHASSVTLRGSLDTYFAELAETLPEGFSEPFSELNEELLEAGRSGQTLAALRRCALALRGVPVRQASPVPYLDLREFLPETVVLAVIADRLPRDGSYAMLLGRGDDEAAAVIVALLEAALRHDLGRLAFRLALRVALLGTTRYTAEQLADLIWRPRFSTELEPDLLTSWADLLVADHRGNRTTAAAALLDESIMLTHLRRRLAERQRRPAGTYPVPSALLPSPSEDVGRPLATVLWQSVLWQLAVQASPVETASRLGHLWCTPMGVPEEPATIRVPLSEASCRELWQELFQLFRLRHLRMRFYVVRGAELELPDAAWVIFSPWLNLNSNPQALWRPSVPRYPGVQHVAAQVRLAAAGALAGRLLLVLPRGNPDRPRFAALLAHVSDVLETLRLPPGVPGVDRTLGAHRLLPGPFLSLAIYLQRRIHVLGSCRDERLAPEDFLILMRRSDSGEPQGSDDESAFVGTILPAVLMSWIQDAFLSATRSSGSRRWLSRLPELYQRQGQRDLERHQLVAELLVRFLHPEVARRNTEQFDWRQASYKEEPLQWRIEHRKLLVSQDLRADEWLQPGWDESFRNLSTPLVRALERLSAVRDPGGLSPEITERWRSEWADLLSRVNSAKLLDRFVRLRLFELLTDASLLADDPHGRELIALTLLEYGSVFELERLFEWLYPTSEEGWTAPPERTIQDLQLSLLHALYQEVDRYGGTPDWRPNPRDVHYVRSERQNEQLVRETLRRVAFFASRSSTAPHRHRLGGALAGLFARALAGQAQRLRWLEAQVELHTSGKRLVLPATEEFVAEWQIRSVAFDPNLLRAKLLIEDLSLGDAYDLFSLPREELQAFLDRRSPAYVVAAAVENPPPDDRQYTAYFHCGLRHYLKATTTRRFEKGELVRLPMVWREGNERPEVDSRSPILRLSERHRAGHTVRLQLREYRRGSASELALRGPGTTWVPDRETWMADLAWLFRPVDQRELQRADREVYAITGPAGPMQPLARGLTQLLLSPTAFGPDWVTVLTYLGATNSPLAWRFSSQPGDVYVLAPSDFVPGDADELADEIEEHQDARGLLVTIRVEASDGRIQLRLVRDAWQNPETTSRYPQRQAPFDRRNLSWRDLFRSADLQVAHSVDESWKIEVQNPPPGFPSRVQVRLRGQGFDDESEVEMTVVGWDPWKGEVTGESVQTYQLQLPPDVTPQDFVNRWLGLRRGEHFRLVRALGPVTLDGDVRCRTSEGLLVWAEAESLSMRLLPTQEAPEIHGPRIAEVVNQRWFPIEERPILDPTSLPLEVRERGRGQGVLVRIPRWTAAAATLCEIWWHLGETIIKDSHQIENLRQFKISVGARINANCNDGAWTFQLETATVRVRALWTATQWHRPTPGLSYLERVAVGDETRALAESEPGRLLILPAEASARRHLAEGDGSSFQGGLGTEQRTSNTARRSWRIGHDEFRRASLSFRNGVLCGTCRADAPAQNVVVSQIQLTLEPREGGLHVLRRYFRLTAGEVPRAERVRVLDDAVQWQNKLDVYLASPRDLDCSLDAERREVRLYELRVPPVSPGVRWTTTIPLADDKGPFVTSVNYATEGARVRLFEGADGRILASFKRVPPYTIDGFRRELRNPEFDRLVKLEKRLYYAGPEGAPDGSGETWHRFEWGYGCTLAAPESRLRFDGQPFQSARAILFFGDAVTGLTFLRGVGNAAAAAEVDLPDDESGGDSALEDSLLEINELQLVFSDATSLFLQRSRYRIVHLLHLNMKPDGVFEIRFILGMDTQSLKMTGTFQVERAVLDATSEELLRERWSREPASDDGEDDETQEGRLVLARLDAERFRSSLGVEVVFQHVRMSFESTEQAAPLRDGELVFVRAGNVIPPREAGRRRALPGLKNDTGLQLLPWSSLDDRDVGEDCRRLLMLRRPFSVRQDLLPRIFEAGGAGALAGSALLVNLTSRKGRVSCALWWDEARLAAPRKGGKATTIPRIPARTLGALQRAASEGVVLGSVIQAAAAGLQVELKPGVFVTLPGNRVASRPQDLRTGDLVRIENEGNRSFLVTRATQSEEWYVQRGLRPTVVLPMNVLLDEEKIKSWNPHNALAWQGTDYRNECFSIGGLPNVLAVPGHYDERLRHWEPPVAEHFIELMRTSHPKVAFVGRDEQGAARLQPASDDAWAGRLKVNQADQTALFASLSTAREGADSRALRWELLSFADEPVSSLALRVESESWRYHDAETGTWLASGGIDPQPLGDHTGREGPLFFEQHANELRLRYTEPNLPRFGFPVRELVSALLRREGHTARFVVAALLSEGGLWIELAPGRLVDLPAALVVAKIEGREQSLSNLHWLAFAPGDQITLSLSSSDPMTIDRIALEDWSPGPRLAFGRRSLLPVLAIDRERGAVRLGGGAFQLELPLLWTEDVQHTTVVLLSDNSLLEAQNRLPDRGDTVLLGLSAQGHPTVLGLPGFRPLADAQQPTSWELDPLAADMAALNLPAWRRDEQLASVIVAAGGAVPVTVELAVPANKVLYFSRRLQRSGSVVPENCVTLGRPIGLLRDGENALVLCGSGLLKVPLATLVSGLPRELSARAVETLLQRRTVLWLRGGRQQGPLRCGLNDEPGSPFNVQPVAVIGDQQGKNSWWGVVCRSQSSFALYWLPAREAAWTSLSAEELAIVFPPERRFRVRLGAAGPGSPGVSLTGVAEVRKELASVSVGKELEVQIVARRAGEPGEPTKYLVTTRSSGVALEMEAYDEEQFTARQPVLVEVTRRSVGIGGQPTVTTVPVGKKRYFLDLPAWMVDGGSERPALRLAFQEYLSWLVEEPALPDVDKLGIKAATEAELRRWLCRAWRLRPEGPDALVVTRCQIGLADEWLRRSLSMSEIDLPYALISLLLLQKTADRGPEKIAAIQPGLSNPEVRALLRSWRRQAFEVAQNLGQRALRSLHVEVLWQEWLRPDAEPPRVGDLRHRLRQLKEGLRPGLTLEVLHAFQQYCHAVELRESLPGYAPLLPLADALRRATGDLERTGSLLDRAEILRSLLEIYRAFPAGRSNEHPELLPSHVRKLETLLETINAQRIDITLLEPLTGSRISTRET